MPWHSPSDHVLRVQVHLQGAASTVVITMIGEIDRDSSSRIRDAVGEVLERHQPCRLCLDLERVTFLDSAGVRTLLQCHEQTAGRCCELSISRAHPGVVQVLAITALLETFGLAGRAAGSPGGSPG